MNETGPLTIALGDAPVRTRFVRILVPSEGPLFLHVDEVEVYGPAPGAGNLALRKPADQSSLSPWSTAKIRVRGDYPTGRVLDQGLRLAAHLAGAGVPVQCNEHDYDAAVPG